jgi:hypothetical protein
MTDPDFPEELRVLGFVLILVAIIDKERFCHPAARVTAAR